MATLRISSLESLAEESRRLLPRLAARAWRDQVYLAGSAALSLYLGHRPVRDLDLMSPSNRLGGRERRDLLQDLISLDPATGVETARDGFLFVRFSTGVGVKFYYYPYPLIDPEETVGEISVASPMDLGLMKLGAIISRGSRRDFVDLYLLCKRLPLPDLLARANDKYGHVRDFPLQALKGLADLSLTDGEPMPELSRHLKWGAVQDWLEVQVKTLARQTIGLASEVDSLDLAE